MMMMMMMKWQKQASKQDAYKKKAARNISDKPNKSVRHITGTPLPPNFHPDLDCL
jgi:hypothetical protein